VREGLAQVALGSSGRKKRIKPKRDGIKPQFAGRWAQTVLRPERAQDGTEKTLKSSSA